MQLKQELQQKGWAQFLSKGKSSIFQYLKIRYFYCWDRSLRVEDLIPRLSRAISQDQHCSTSCKQCVHNAAPGTVSRGPSRSSGHIPGCIPASGLSRTTRMAPGRVWPGSPGVLALQGPSAAGGSAGGTIYLVNFRGRRFNCFKLPLEKPEWSTINQADLAPRAHPPRAGNQLPPRDLLLMNFAALLIKPRARVPGIAAPRSPLPRMGTSGAAQPAQLSLPSREEYSGSYRQRGTG